MIRKEALFPGNCEVDQIFRIFRMLGTPSGKLCPELQKCPFFKGSFPRFKAVPLKEIFPETDQELVGFIKKFLQMERKDRINIYQALEDPIFQHQKS